MKKIFLLLLTFLISSSHHANSMSWTDMLLSKLDFQPTPQLGAIALGSFLIGGGLMFKLGRATAPRPVAQNPIESEKYKRLEEKYAESQKGLKLLESTCYDTRYILTEQLSAALEKVNCEHNEVEQLKETIAKNQDSYALLEKNLGLEASLRIKLSYENDRLKKTNEEYAQFITSLFKDTNITLEVDPEKGNVSYQKQSKEEEKTLTGSTIAQVLNNCYRFRNFIFANDIKVLIEKTEDEQKNKEIFNALVAISAKPWGKHSKNQSSTLVEVSNTQLVGSYWQMQCDNAQIIKEPDLNSSVIEARKNKKWKSF